jgi:hypothetical protein
MVNESVTPWWSPLVGVVVGVLLSAFITYFMEWRKWRRQRRDKRNEDTRLAIEAALAWLDPIDLVLVFAEIEAYALLNGTKDEDQFRQAYPSLIPQIAKVDLPPHQRLRLPSDAYQIVQCLDRVRGLQARDA